MTDLMEEARAAFEPIRADFAIARGVQYDRAIEAIARALAAAEQRGREEAAKVVEGYGLMHALGQSLAAAIRRGEP